VIGKEVNVAYVIVFLVGFVVGAIGGALVLKNNLKKAEAALAEVAKVKAEIATLKAKV
jgi:hypothetical protein